MRIAIVGAGIAGLGAAFLLHPRHIVVVYEKDRRPGGHSRTIDLDVDGVRVAVDTGFMVFNERNYPLLSALFRHLGVTVRKAGMSFGVSIAEGWLEYGSESLRALLGQARNLARPRFWGMLVDILRFNRSALRCAADAPELTLGEVADRLALGEWFRRYYLWPMIAAIWSAPAAAVEALPAQPYLRFLDEHGLLTVSQQPQWFTVCGGSRAYIDRLCEGFRSGLRCNCPVTGIHRKATGIEIVDAHGGRESFDHVVIAAHPDQALALLKDPSEDERSALGAFRYRPNRAYVHRDTSLMPRRRSCWSCWNYLSPGREDGSPSVGVSYWLDKLQALATPQPIIATLNPPHPPASSAILDDFIFEHLQLDAAALAAQARLTRIQGERNTWYCGAYLGYGFHEDGLKSAVLVAARLGCRPPWS